MSNTNTSQDLDNFEQSSNEIQLYVYDLSRGFAQSFLSQILGKDIPGIWHSSIIAYGREYFFGGNGIESCDPGTTFLGEPQQIIQLGSTGIPYSLFLEYIFDLGSSTYAIGTYDLFNHNCNNFTNDLAYFMIGKGIPKEILDLPNEILKTPLGKILHTFLSTFNIRPKGQGAQLSAASQLDSNLYLPRSRNSDKKIRNSQNMAEGSFNTETDEDNWASCTKKKVYKYSDPPIVYNDVNESEAVKKLKSSVNDQLNPEEQVLLKEWCDFIINNNGGWSLGEEHMILFRKILDNKNKTYKEESVKLVLKVLQNAALKDGFVLLLHQDTKDHYLMSYLNTIEKIDVDLQEEVCRLVTNFCGLPSSFDWLMYISEWSNDDGTSCSNSKVTSRIAVHCLLHEKNKNIQQLGLNLIWNIALRDVFEDIAMELATALLQYLHNDLNEENVHLALTALLRFMVISPTDIIMLAKMLAPNIERFESVSERNDKLIGEIKLKISCSAN